ncbi:hypothetical protein [Myroides sp. N17-2]|uniref:hypothetical protein n=1 Tax=Myroides sp. N17-2 TaxID=2030799 RepID=UPI00118032A6|nr:hypothetical protein [Myroides sp. N17-2]
MSPDGKWVLIGKTYVDQRDKPQLLYINTQTKKKINLTYLKGIHQNLLFNDLVAGRDNEVLKVVDLKSEPSILTFENIRKYDTKASNNRNLLITLQENSTLSIKEIKSNVQSIKTTLSIDQVHNYFLNPAKTRLVYQLADENNTIGVINLNDYKNSSLTTLNGFIEKIYLYSYFY